MWPGSTPSVVVTGAAGALGGEVVRELRRRDVRVGGLGRRAAPPNFPAPWARVDLLTGDGLAATLKGVDVVVHAASDPFTRGADVEAARQLAAAVREASVSKIVFVQIAGIANAAGASPYYRDKLLSEQMLKGSGVPCSTVAATQFHSLIDRIFLSLFVGPLLLLPKFTLQPVDVRFFADHLADHVIRRSPQDIVISGPEAITSRDMAAAWMLSRQRHGLIMPIPAFGPLTGFSRIQPVDGISGGRSWRTWLSDDQKGKPS